MDVLDVSEGVMLIGKGDKFQLWNPKRWQSRRDADRAIHITPRTTPPWQTPRQAPS